jgi:hypothetical protein
LALGATYTLLPQDVTLGQMMGMQGKGELTEEEKEMARSLGYGSGKWSGGKPDIASGDRRGR